MEGAARATTALQRALAEPAVGAPDPALLDELRVIAEFIAKARHEIRALRPENLRDEGIPTAGAELDAIVRDTEHATHSIMSSAETMLAAETDDVEAYRAIVAQEALAIFEACSFQDITGQRVTKVIDVLRQIEGRVSRLATNLGVGDAAAEETPEERRRREQMLNGPAVDGVGTSSQDDIDALFD